MNNISFHRIAIPVYLTALAICIFSCKKRADYNEPVSNDKSKPGAVTNVKVSNFNGGAYITYSLPKSDNILYVKANYTINDKTGATLESKSSYYSDTLTVNGFAESKDYDVTLSVISRANIASDPVTIKVHPDIPVYQVVRQTLSLTPDFAGIRVTGQNLLKQNVGVVFLYNDPYFKKYTIRQQTFSAFKDISFASRGFDTLPKPVAAYTTDQWGNISDTLFKIINPLYEVPLDKSKFFEYDLPSDSPTDQFGWIVPNLWDGSIWSGWHTNQRAPYVLPPVCTFGFGVSAKLSRFVLFPRPYYLWAHGNPKRFTLWGSNVDQPGDFKPPMTAAEGDVIGDWTDIGNYNYPYPPSGNPPSSPTDADQQWALQGTEFPVSFAAPKVKYIRVVVPENWGGDNSFAHIMELTFYGDPR